MPDLAVRYQGQFCEGVMNVVTRNDQVSELSMREKVFAAEDYIRQMPQLDLKLVHYFSPGVYARELHIPAGVILTGEIHKYRQLNILSKGSISVLLEDGVKRIEAPFTVVSPAGTKRIAYAHTDCVWTTILGTHETDIEKIRDYFIAKSEREWLDFCASTSLLREGEQ
jgi:hypothetical protein